MAMELFWEKGYHATSIHDLVSHLGINRASLYNAFGGKLQLYHQALGLYCEELIDRTEQRLQAEPTIWQGIEQVLMRFVEELSEAPVVKGCFIVNATTELIPNLSETTAILKDFKDRELAIYQRFIQQGVDRGEFTNRVEASDMALYLYTVLTGLAVVAKVDRNRQSLLRVVSKALETFH